MPPNDQNPGQGPGQNPTQAAAASRQFLQGFNTMQMQMGMMPGGMPPIAPPVLPSGPHPGQISAMLQQQSIAQQYALPPPTQVFGGQMMQAPGMFGPSLPPPIMGLGAQARQRGIDAGNRPLAMGQAAMGLGARGLGSMAAGAIGTAMGGPLGGMAAMGLYEMSGVGQGIQNLGNAVFEPIIAQRERALGFQNQSTRFVTGGSNLSATGQGLSGMASQQLAQGINRMADSQSFRKDTQGAFNRSDLDRITRLSGELGLLDNAQTVEQITREVGKVSRGLKGLMTIMGSTDIREAMQQMGRMRTLGFAASEMPAAAANARTFARMAGVSVGEAMQGAERGAATFQQAGMSGASGFTAGLAAQGMARVASQGMSARQLSMAGGIQGIEQSLTAGAANDPLSNIAMTASLRRGANGQLEVNQREFMDNLTHRRSASDIARRAAGRVSTLGGSAVAQEFASRQNELRDQAMAQLSPQDQILAQFAHAQSIQRDTHVTLGAAFRTMGLSEQDANTREQMMRNPNFLRDIQRQQQISQRERTVSARDQLAERTTTRARLGHAFEHSVSTPLSEMAGGVIDPVTGFLSQMQDREEALALQGSGPARIIGANRGGSAAMTLATRARMRNNPRAVRESIARLGAEAARGGLREDAIEEANNQGVGQSLLSGNVMGIGMSLARRHFSGPEGFGIDREARGGDSLRSTIVGGMSGLEQAREAVGFGRSAADLRGIADGQVNQTRVIEGSQRGTTRQQAARSNETGTRLSMTAEERGAAAMAVRNVVRSGTGVLGSLTGDTSDTAVRAAIRQSVIASGGSAARAEQVSNDAGALEAAHNAARATMTEDERTTHDSMAQAGRDTGGMRDAGQRARLMAGVENARERAGDKLGFNVGNDMDADQQAGLFGMLATTGGEEQKKVDMRRKVYAAYMMTQSDDEETKQRGAAELERLKAENGEDYADALDIVKGQVDALSDSDREDAAAQFAGRSVEEANQKVSNAVRAIDDMQAGSIANAEVTVLGSAAAAFDAAGGGEAGAEALRRNPSQVKSTRIKRMIESGASNADIAAAVEEETGRAIGSDGVDAGGAADTAADGESGADSTALMDAISEGMTEFPGAVSTLQTASDQMLRAANAILDAHGMRQLNETVYRAQ